MTYLEICERLCYYDPRNPKYKDMYVDFEDVREPRLTPCYCDNCFYGRDKLALELLKYVSS